MPPPSLNVPPPTCCSTAQVLQSISPVVRDSIGKPIEVVVERAVESGQSEQLKLTLVPERWEGQGLLGCIIK